MHMKIKLRKQWDQIIHQNKFTTKQICIAFQQRHTPDGLFGESSSEV